ncbi:hypothetical protein QTV49_004552 [Vibrio vulnificus]|nr:hypothetical protein [Vibrio vulnificus]
MSDEQISIKHRFKSLVFALGVTTILFFLVIKGGDLIAYLAARYNW